MMIRKKKLLKGEDSLTAIVAAIVDLIIIPNCLMLMLGLGFVYCVDYYAATSDIGFMESVMLIIEMVVLFLLMQILPLVLFFCMDEAES